MTAPASRYLRRPVNLIAIALSLYLVATLLQGNLEPMRFGPIVLGVVLLIGFLENPLRAGVASRSLRLALAAADLLLVALAAAAIAYLQVNYREVVSRFPYITPLTPLEIGLAAGLTLAVLELTRRTTGWPLAAFFLLVVAHAVYGDRVITSGPLRTPSVPLLRVLEQLYLTDQGLFSSIFQMTGTYVFAFVLLGETLTATGADRLFTAVGGIFRGSSGGPQKVACISSAALGTINSSVLSHIYTVGTVTIPFMIRSGLSSARAAATEAVAASLATIVPPVMGTGAFIMAEFLGRPYGDIMKANVIPSMLVLATLLAIIHVESLGRRPARATGAPGDAAVDLSGLETPLWPAVRAYGLVLLAIVLLVYLIVNTYTAFTAAMWSVLAAWLLGLLRRKTRVGFAGVMGVLGKAGSALVTVGMALAVAGAVSGLLHLTGLHVRFSSIILGFTGSSMVPTLLVAGLVTVMLGVGLPATADYVVSAVLTVPALTSAGVSPLAAHMFVFYLSSISGFTPPVCLYVFAAASIARANIWRTAYHAVRYGVLGYLIPFLFPFAPALMLAGGWGEVASTTLAAAVVIAAGTYACVGAHLRWPVRGVLAAVAGLGAFSLVSRATAIQLGLAIAGLLALAWASREWVLRRGARREVYLPEP